MLYYMHSSTRRCESETDLFLNDTLIWRLLSVYDDEKYNNIVNVILYAHMEYPSDFQYRAALLDNIPHEKLTDRTVCISGHKYCCRIT